jgi:hypothetical protein
VWSNASRMPWLSRRSDRLNQAAEITGRQYVFLSAQTYRWGAGRETGNREAGIVYVGTEGLSQRGEIVLDYARWVMVRKRDKDAPAPPASVPKLAAAVPHSSLSPGLGRTRRPALARIAFA